MVQLHSVQADQHSCTFSVHMISRDGSLAFESEHGNVMVMKEDGDIRVISDSDPTALGLGFCGAHADIDGLTFPINSKLDADSSDRCPF